MPLCGTIGFSVALFVLSAAALAESGSPTETAPPIKHQPVFDRSAAAKANLAKPQHKTTRMAVRPTFRASAPRVRPRFALAGPPDRYVGQARSPHAAQVGRAAWYGGHHLGLRTASGAALDSIHPTAAHRSLPLNSLARVTNMNNGRSVIVVVNDRGPTSPSLIIDLSPRAAQALDMIHAGIVPVTVEPLAMEAAAVPHE